MSLKFDLNEASNQMDYELHENKPFNLLKFFNVNY